MCRHVSCDDLAVAFEIRYFAAADAGNVVALAIRVGLDNVFESLRAVPGASLLAALPGEDWRPGQAADVTQTIPRTE
jgi:hypothetical protein